ncbi:MAG: hypothetical protein EB127_18620 [Alphaproteobacteria bacterium]|nr:hypothetical protein [Alphaproteobacteria bacterium]
MSTEDYHALWRASAHESVPYTDDFPKALLVLPELSDGSIGHGNATSINIQISLSNNNSKLKVTDNGGGIRNERRLLAWAAKKATSNMHRNGHGTKKCLTMWEPDYEKANWTIRWRLPGKNLQTTTSPFKGYSPDSIIDDEGEDKTTLMPSGCEISIDFSANSVLGDLANNPDGLSTAVKEIIQTRYSEEILSKTEFILNISHSSLANPILRSSKKDKWHSFRKCVEDSIKTGVVKKRHESKYEFDGGCLSIDVYSIEGDGKRSYKLKDEFPTYGNKNMKSSRVHTSLDVRTIEAKPAYQLLLGVDANHNKYNGLITFANFTSNTKEDYEKLPIPCTTKVSMYVNHSVYALFIKEFNTVFPPIVREIEVEVEKRLTEKKIKKVEAPVLPLNVVVTKKPVAKSIVAPALAPVTPAPVVPPSVVAPPAPVVAPAAVIAPLAPVVPLVVPPVVTPPIPVAPVLPTPPVITPLPPRSVTPVGGHNRLNGCSRQNLFDLLLCFKEKINTLPLETLRENASATTEPGLAQKIQALREILESLV